MFVVINQVFNAVPAGRMTDNKLIFGRVGCEDGDNNRQLCPRHARK